MGDIEMNLIDGFTNQLHNENKSPNTIYNYELAVKDFFKWFAGTYDKEPTQLFPQNIKDYVQYLQTVKGSSAKTINARLASLLKYNEYLVSMGVQKNIVINKNQKKKVQQQYASPAQYSEKEVNKFIQAVIEKGNKRDYALVMLLAYTGCRISEALNIDKDLHLASQKIVIRSGKGDKERTVLVHNKVVAAIKEYLKERNNHKHADSSYLFISNKGEQLSRITANDMFKKYSKKAGLDTPLHPHALRHYWCSRALENGFDVHEVANMAGHSNIHTTLLYTNPSRQKMLEKLNRL
jgi:integrase/recombinase XerD